jgi:hypothetical protein
MAPLNILEIGDVPKDAPGTYSLDKPHPGYGKDPRIINQLGHTTYPRWAYPNGNQAPGVIVQTEAEYDEVMGELSDKPKSDW